MEYGPEDARNNVGFLWTHSSCNVKTSYGVWFRERNKFILNKCKQKKERKVNGILSAGIWNLFYEDVPSVYLIARAFNIMGVTQYLSNSLAI